MIQPTNERPKQKIYEKIIGTYLDRYDFSGTPDSVIAKLQEWKKEYGDDVEISWAQDYDGESEPGLFKVRLETDEEYNTRRNHEDYWRKSTEERERIEYERLKAKFG